MSDALILIALLFIGLLSMGGGWLVIEGMTPDAPYSQAERVADLQAAIAVEDASK